MTLGTVKTGVQTTIKAGATDANKAEVAQTKADIEKAELDATKLAEGNTCYTKIGEPVFNCLTPAGKKLQFKGGKFTVEGDDPDAEAMISTLDYFVSRKLLTKTEG
jgi:hypothetical protein